MNTSAATISLIVFILVYICFVIFSEKRAWVALGGAVLLLFLGVIPPQEAFLAVNWNVMAIFVGTLVLAELFLESGMPAYIAECIVNRARSTRQAILWICLFTGFVSAFVENVATVLIMAPIAFSLAKKLKINPTNLIIAIAVSSNLQGTATLIGDPPSMLLAGFARMNFWDFFIYKARPSIFFAVELGALASLLVLWRLFRKQGGRSEIPATETVKTYFPSMVLGLLVISLAFSSFVDPDFRFAAGLICLFFAIAGLVWETVFAKGALFKRIKGLDWETAFFLIGVFILVGSLTYNGWIERSASALSGVIGGNLLSAYLAIVFVSMAFSAFVDNVPFLAAMLPLVISLSGKLQIEPSLLLFGLLIGSCLGGNITPIGASANIVGCGLLKKHGFSVKFAQFVRVGLPLTLAAVTAGGLFVWIVWAR